MADWWRIFMVDLVGSARLLDVFQPLVSPGTAAVCFASMAAQMLAPNGDPVVDALLDDPLRPDLLDLIEAAVHDVHEPGVAYAWAKRGVQRLARREAVRRGTRGGRVCSVSPGIVDTPQGRQEAEVQPAMETLVQLTPRGRIGQPTEIANLVAYLHSDGASFVTGTDILIDVAAMSSAGTSRRPSLSPRPEVATHNRVSTSR